MALAKENTPTGPKYYFNVEVLGADGEFHPMGFGKGIQLDPTRNPVHKGMIDKYETDNDHVFEARGSIDRTKTIEEKPQVAF